MTYILLVFIFFCANPFLLYSVAWVGAVSNMCNIFLFMVFLEFHMSSHSYSSF